MKESTKKLFDEARSMVANAFERLERLEHDTEAFKARLASWRESSKKEESDDNSN